MKANKLKVYMKMAREVATLSPDQQTKVGCILLSKDQRIIASSFNGFLRGANDALLPKTRPEKYQYIQHAERNALYNCAYQGIATRDTTLICTLSPCLECLRACFQSGISTIIYEDFYAGLKTDDIYTTLLDVKVQVSKIGKYTKLELS